MRKFYAIGYDEASALKACVNGWYTNQPFWPEYDTLLPYLEQAKKIVPEIPLRIYTIKVGG
jgi:hypothetical protein